MKGKNHADLHAMFTAVLHSVAPRTKPLEPRLDQHLTFDIGLDSLEMISLVSEMIAHTGAQLSSTIISQTPTVGVLIDIFATHMGDATT